MTTIYLVRHGESLSQTGHDRGLDPELSDRGRLQATRLRRRFDGMRFDRILVSPLRRAWQTFVLSGAASDRVEFDSRLIECGFGRSYRGMERSVPKQLAAPDRHEAWDVPSSARVASLLADLKTYEQETVGIFGHWAFFSMLLLAFLTGNAGDEPAPGNTQVSAVMENCCISVLALNHSRYGNCVLEWNSRDHVAELLDGISGRPSPNSGKGLTDARIQDSNSRHIG